MAREKAKPTATGATRARVLFDCSYGNCNDVVEVPTEQLAQAVALGFVDANPDAVAYAESLKG